MFKESEDPEFMGGSWYCGGCGCEFTPKGDPHPPEAECPDCGRILARSGGYVNSTPTRTPKRLMRIGE